MVIEEHSILIEDIDLEYHDYTRDRLFSRGRISSFHALKRIKCEITRGENVALLGKNGAGKSTLLKCIAGIIRPSAGTISTFGRVILLSGSDPGFLPHLTGGQNVIELATAYGIKDSELGEFYDSVVEFAEIGEAIDRNFKGYSTGMRGKLGFGFLTALRPEILLIDETLGVGDLEFRKKASDRLEEFIQNSGTVIISTHSLNLAKKICSRGLVVDEGVLVYDGDSAGAVDLHISNSEN